MKAIDNFFCETMEAVNIIILERNTKPQSENNSN